jgi:hypothetical protein
MGIADERRIAELRYRRSRNRNLIRAIGYLSSLIPAILIAFNFEAFRRYVIVAFGGLSHNLRIRLRGLTGAMLESDTPLSTCRIRI